jgi:hypothetical protein
MTGCPTPEELRQLLEEPEDGTQAAAFTAHLEGCRACQEALEQLTGAGARPDPTPAVPVSDDGPPPTLVGEGAFLRRLEQALRPSTRGSVQAGTNADPGAPPGAVGGYEVVGELGRGGMGVVYKAWQGRLRRVVALKMLTAGAAALPEGRARLQTEAEALARLRHPHIVQVHEVGEQDGRLFLVLEYADRGSLAQRLRGAPLPSPAAARLVETLAEAVHFAHRQGILHRDLKPGNILLAGDGAPPTDAADPLAGCVPKVADFGLAKLLVGGADALTQTGGVLGTPSYMAPEQADGKGKEATAAVDVYAVGAVLYECLHGRPPFRAATALETLQQVLADEPVPPRQLNPAVPRDLETICLKCLRKEPHKRYAGAGALAEDLRRFRTGEPITARPVGRLERTGKWLRRNPVAAALIATVILGTTISSYLAFVADDRARQVVKNLRDKEEEQQRTPAAPKKAEENYADGLFRPVGAGRRGVLGGMDNNELNALWATACLTKDEERVRLLFLDRALHRPQTAEQLSRRSAKAVHAAVGLDRGRRERVLELVRPRLGDPTLDWRVRAAAGAVVAELAPANADDAAAAALALAEAIRRPPDDDALIELSGQVEALAPVLRPAEASAVTRQIVDAMTRRATTDSLAALAGALAKLAPRLDDEGARAAVEQILEVMVRTPSSSGPGGMVKALAALAPRLDHSTAARAVEQLQGAFRKPPRGAGNGYRQSTVGGLAALAPGLNREGRVAVARWIAGELLKMPEINLRFQLAGSLATVVRLDEEAGAAVTEPILDHVLAPVAKEDRLASMAPVLAAFAPRLSRQRKESVARKLLAALGKTPVTPHDVALTDLLEALAPPPRGAAAPDEAAAAAMYLLEEMARSPNVYALRTDGLALTAVIGWLDDAAATASAGVAVQTILNAAAKDRREAAILDFSPILVKLAPRMDEKARAATLQKVLLLFGAAVSNQSLGQWSQVLAALLPLVDRAEARAAAGAAAQTLARAMQRCPNTTEFQYLAAAFVTLAPTLDEKTTRELAAAGARRLTDLMELARDENLYGYGRQLAMIAPWLDEEVAATTVGKVGEAADRNKGPQALPELAAALAALSPRLNERATSAAVRKLLDTAARSPRSKSLSNSALSRAVANRSAPELVELLKHPGCVGQARAVVLQKMGEKFDRRFSDVWELVDWLAVNAPEIDAASPPVRTQP